MLLAAPTITPLSTRHLLTGGELSPAELGRLLDTAVEWKREPGAFEGALSGKTVVMVFEKPSLRTRLSFEIGAQRLGARAVYMDISGQRIGVRESAEDYAQNLALWSDAIVARTYSHHAVASMAKASSVPVINGLSEHWHPCQTLADLLTMRERFGSLAGVKVAWIGDGNNVCNSLLLGAAAMAMDMLVIAPEGFDPSPEALKAASRLAKITGGSVMVTDEVEAVYGRQVVYTDTWVSMGQDSDADARRAALAPFQVNADLMAQAAPDAIFMHCLPAHRGEEVTGDVIDSDSSVVLRQADNRLHAQNALLLHLLGAEAA